MRRWGCPPLLALLDSSRVAGALAAPLSWRYFIIFDPTPSRDAQRRFIGFRLIVRAPFLWTSRSATSTPPECSGEIAIEDACGRKWFNDLQSS